MNRCTRASRGKSLPQTSTWAWCTINVYDTWCWINSRFERLVRSINSPGNQSRYSLEPPYIAMVPTQPNICQGRKRAGGIRFGEMERDALIAHGTSFLLQDRLMNCSDYSTAWVCRTCGSLISLGYEDVSLGDVFFGSPNVAPKPAGPDGEYCRVCRARGEEADARARQALAGLPPTSDGRTDLRITVPKQNILSSTGHGGDLDVVAVPYVFRYLCAELASMSIAISLEVR